jgi:hypothetical protein
MVAFAVLHVGIGGNLKFRFANADEMFVSGLEKTSGMRDR